MRRKDREIKNYDQLLEILSQADTCRLAFSNDNIPYIVAMNYGFVEGEKTVLYFHTAKKGKKLDMLANNNYVCFQVDTNHNLISGDKACDYTMTFKSIVGYGNIEIVDEKNEKILALNKIMQHYTDKKVWEYPDRMLNATCILKLTVTEMTGKALQQ